MAERREDWLKRMTATLAVDPEDLLEVAAMFFETIDERLNQIAAAAADGDSETLMRLAHGLKGDSANIGFNEISTMARELERQSRRSEIKDVAEQVSALQEASRSMKETLKL